MQVSVRTGRVARRCWRAASPGDVLREASRLLPVFEGTNHVYTMTYLQQTVSFGILVLLKLRLSQVLPMEHQEGGWKNQVPFASITTGDTGKGTGQWPQLYLCPWYKCLASSGPQLFILLLLIIWQLSKCCLEGVYFCATLEKQSWAKQSCHWRPWFFYILFWSQEKRKYRTFFFSECKVPDSLFGINATTF